MVTNWMDRESLLNCHMEKDDVATETEEEGGDETIMTDETTDEMIDTETALADGDLENTALLITANTAYQQPIYRLEPAGKI
jgi:hypothetical protein